MNVKKEIDLGSGHKIEFGEATWDNTKISVRNRYLTSTGGFSPRSSSEIPIEDIKLLIIESIRNNYINKDDIKDVITEGLKVL